MSVEAMIKDIQSELDPDNKEESESSHSSEDEKPAKKKEKKTVKEGKKKEVEKAPEKKKKEKKQEPAKEAPKKAARGTKKKKESSDSSESQSESASSSSEEVSDSSDSSVDSSDSSEDVEESSSESSSSEESESSESEDDAAPKSKKRKQEAKKPPAKKRKTAREKRPAATFEDDSKDEKDAATKEDGEAIFLKPVGVNKQLERWEALDWPGMGDKPEKDVLLLLRWIALRSHGTKIPTVCGIENLETHAKACDMDTMLTAFRQHIQNMLAPLESTLGIALLHFLNGATECKYEKVSLEKPVYSALTGRCFKGDAWEITVQKSEGTSGEQVQRRFWVEYTSEEGEPEDMRIFLGSLISIYFWRNNLEALLKQHALKEDIRMDNSEIQVHLHLSESGADRIFDLWRKLAMAADLVSVNAESLRRAGFVMG